MKIIQIVPGSGGTFYCENCLRDSSLTVCLRTMGHDAVLVPMYLPVFSDEPEAGGGDTPVFFGGINVYLQQKFGFFRKTPRWLDRFFDSRWLLQLAARRAGSTTAAGMGALTFSMIQGADGRQAKELDRLIDWLAEHEKPDIVHIATILLIGLAARIKERIGVPVVVSMQDEHVWLDALDKPYDRRCWDAIGEKVNDCDAFIAVSDYYGRFMRERAGIPAQRLHTVRIGIDTTGYTPAALDFDPPTIGYLSKMTPSLGFGRLIDAFIRLRQEDGMGKLRLRAMGGMTGGDRLFLDEIRSRLARAGLTGDVDLLPDLDRASRQKFLSSLSVLCVPIEEGEAFGSFMIESWAAAVPVVMPKAGGFVELIEATGGGVMYDGRDMDLARTFHTLPAGTADSTVIAGRNSSARPQCVSTHCRPAESIPTHTDGTLHRSGSKVCEICGLVTALGSLLRDPERARRLGKAGRQAVMNRFTIRNMADDTLRVYEGTMRK